MNHYHIHWAKSEILWAKSELDWEPFQAEEEAAAAAEQLKHPGETYVIEKRGGDCRRCAELESPTTIWA